jgi:pyruvate dehydrogenase E2 component (dihydrolipoamide acetyltransferase)
MPTPVLIPPLGQTIDTLTFVSWYKQEGEAVQQGELLFVIETDKATLDVEAPASGILRSITAQPGDEVQTLSAVAVIAAADEIAEEGGEGNSEELRGTERSSQEREEVFAAPAGSQELPSAPPGSALRLFASPRARRLAEQMGVPLAAVAGSGPEGAIVERDVRAAVAQSEIGDQRSGVGGRRDVAALRERVEPGITPVARRVAEAAGLDWRAVPGSGPRGQITRQDVEAALPAVPPAPSSPPADLVDTIPLGGVRAIIAERMARSHTETAAVTLTTEVDATELVETRRRLAEQDVAVSYSDLLIAILARALAEHPRLNASLDGDAIKLWRRIDIGLAVDTDRGLLVPVVRKADHKGLAQLAAETRDLAERARRGKLTPDELRGSTFTLTNLGMFGVDAFTPIINLPETAILGVGRIKERPTVAAGQVVAKPIMWLSLTFDHRLVDGGLAARFLQRVAQLVEQPVLLLA